MHRTLLSCFINFCGAFKVRLNCTAQFYIALFTSELHRTVCAVHLRYALIAPHSPELLLGKVTISIMRFCYSVQCGALRCILVHFSRYRNFYDLQLLMLDLLLTYLCLNPLDIEFRVCTFRVEIVVLGRFLEISGLKKCNVSNLE